MKQTIAQVYSFISSGNTKRANEVLENFYADAIQNGTADEETEYLYKKMKVWVFKEIGDLDAALEIYKSMNLHEDHEAYFTTIFEMSELLLRMERQEESLAMLESVLKAENMDVVAHGSYLLHIYSQFIQLKGQNADTAYISFIHRFADTLGLEGYQPDTSDAAATLASIEELLWRESDSGYRFADLHQELKGLEDKTQKIAALERYIADEPLAYYRQAAQAVDQSEW